MGTGALTARRAVARACCAILLAAAAGACRDDTGPAPAEDVRITLPRTTMHPTETLQTVATVLDAGGSELSGRPVAWGTSSPAVFVVSGGGVVTAVGVGTATISAQSGQVLRTTSITVIPVPVASLVVSPSSACVDLAERVTLAAALKDSAGGDLGGRPVTWSSNLTNFATVDPATGVVTGRGYGVATITATSEGKTGTATVISGSRHPVASVVLTPTSASLHPGETVQIDASTHDSEFNRILCREVAWSTNNAAVATVDQNGLVRAVAVGSATITATSQGKSRSLVVTVTAP